METGTIIIIAVFIAATAVQIILFRKKSRGDNSILADYDEMKQKIKELENEKIVLIEDKSRFTTLCEGAQKQKNEADEAKKQAENQVKEKQEKINELEKEIAGLYADLRASGEKLTTQKKEIESLQENAKNEFKNIANEILTANTKAFNENNANKLKDILKPFSDNFGEFKKKVEETYDKEARQRTSLEQQVKDLLAQTNKVSEQANNLAAVLKGDKKKQGIWGEKILETILEKSGLIKNTHYELQPTDSHGKRPDAVVYLPDNRAVIIDAKVSLINYTYYSEADETEDKKNYLKEYKNDVYRQISNLSSKNYDKEMSEKSLDFMIMLFPVEAAYLTLIQEFNELWNEAYEKRILLVSPTNLIACSKLIESLWRRDDISKNAQEIVRVGTSLYEKFAGFAKDIEDIGRFLEKSRDSYDEAVKKLSSGKGNLVRTAENLIKLGIKPNKQIPKSLCDDIEGLEALPTESFEQYPSLRDV
ncbi:MAG: DNA recombination protein RmuC [Chitinispirillales bacterium]|jgi:DNA recombination protein RmuC|nr:DNA recombination protein RmuC [Chitinispirillales bacterium]